MLYPYQCRDEIDLEQAKKWYDLSPIVEQFGTWAVTKYGIECLTNYYPIEKERLWHGEPSYGWVKQMSTKSPGVYGYIEDFKPCLEAARIYHAAGPKHRPIRPAKVMRIREPRPPKVVVAREPKSPKVRMFVTLRDRFVIFKRDNYRCRICGRDASDGVKLHVDHIIAKSKGGTSEHVNLWTCCFECNHGKFTNDL